MIFHWSLSYRKSPQVFMTLFSNPSDLNNAVVWMVSTRPLISKFSSPCTNSLVNVRRAPIIIGMNVPQFFQLPSKVELLILLFTFFQFYSVVSWDCKVHNFSRSFFFFCCCSLFLVLVVWPKLGDLFVCQNRIGVCRLYSPG